MPYSIRKLKNRNLYRVTLHPKDKKRRKVIAKATTLEKAQKQVRLLRYLDAKKYKGGKKECNKNCDDNKLKPFYCRLGAKHRFIKDICELIPSHKIYVEAFLGGGSVFWAKDKAEKNILNDLDKNVIDYHKLLKNVDLSKKYTIPFTTNEEATKYAWEKHTNKKDQFIASLFKSCGTFGGKQIKGSKIYIEKVKKKDLKKELNNKIQTENIEKYKNKLKNVTLLNQDYKKVIRKYDSPKTFFFLDPPYEKSEKLYKDGSLNFEELRDILKTIKGKFMLTLNDSPYIKKLFNNYKIKTIMLGSVGGMGIGKPRKELIIMNYNIEKGGEKIYDDDELIEELKGAGIWDWVKKQYRKLPFVKKATEIIDAPTKLNNVSTETLNKYGNCPIEKITIMRTPIQKPLGYALNALTFGKWFNLMRKYGFDKFYHLGLVCMTRCADGILRPVVFEKNEVVNISNEFSISRDSEFMNVELDKRLTLNELKNNCLTKMGTHLFYDYDAFKNNCQVFIKNLLDASGLLNQEYYDFLFQDLTKLYDELPKYLSPVVKVITRLGAIVNRLKGGGKLEPFLMKKEYPKNYDDEVKNIIEKISFKNENVDILGSMSFRSIHYSSDYDCFEIVRLNSIEELERDFKQIIRNIKNDKNIYFGDIKIGSIDKWKVLNDNMYFDSNDKLRLYDKEKSMDKLNQLLNDKVITRKEYNEGLKLLKDDPKIEDVKNMVKKMRFNILRWTPKDILDGYIILRNGEKYTLKEALQDKSLFKLDTIALIDNKYTEFSIIYDVIIENKRINYEPIDTKKTLKNDIILYESIGNYFKLLKRLFSLYNYEIKYDNDKSKIPKIKNILKILNSDLGIMYVVIQDLDVLIYLIKEGRGNMREIKQQVNKFIGDLSDVYNAEYIKYENKILNKLNSKKDLLNNLENVKSELEDILNKETVKRINDFN